MMFFIMLATATSVRGEDGSRLWLRFEGGGLANVTGVANMAMEELKQNWQGGPVVLKRKKGMAKDSYTITNNGGETIITACEDAGMLYGAYHLLSIQQMVKDVQNMNINESPDY